jgi:hypothetical protein
MQQQLNEIAGWQNVASRMALRHYLVARGSQTPEEARNYLKNPWKWVKGIILVTGLEEAMSDGHQKTALASN